MDFSRVAYLKSVFQAVGRYGAQKAGKSRSYDIDVVNVSMTKFKAGGKR